MRVPRLLGCWIALALVAPVQGQESPERDPGPVPRTGRAGPGLRRFDRIMVRLMERHSVPGGSLSIAKSGRLVYARGFGWANVEAQEPPEPATRFGLASVSKAITAVTILKLVDAGKLQLDDRVFTILDHLRPPPGDRVDPRVRQITVRQLLNHSSGFPRHVSGTDAAQELGVPTPATPAQIIRYQLGRPLDHEPGTKAVYSNFGFLVLGQVIERVTGEPYLEYVRRNTLLPMGIVSASCGSPGPRYPPGVARRYGSRGGLLPPQHPGPYSAAGGWIASSVDMIRFLTALDGTRGQPCLSASTVQQMLAPPDPELIRKNGRFFVWAGTSSSSVPTARPTPKAAAWPASVPSSATKPPTSIGPSSSTAAILPRASPAKMPTPPRKSSAGSTRRRTGLRLTCLHQAGEQKRFHRTARALADQLCAGDLALA